MQKPVLYRASRVTLATQSLGLVMPLGVSVQKAYLASQMLVMHFHQKMVWMHPVAVARQQAKVAKSRASRVTLAMQLQKLVMPTEHSLAIQSLALPTLVRLDCQLMKVWTHLRVMVQQPRRLAL